MGTDAAVQLTDCHIDDGDRSNGTANKIVGHQLGKDRYMAAEESEMAKTRGEISLGKWNYRATHPQMRMGSIDSRYEIRVVLLIKVMGIAAEN